MVKPARKLPPIPLPRPPRVPQRPHLEAVPPPPTRKAANAPQEEAPSRPSGIRLRASRPPHDRTVPFGTPHAAAMGRARRDSTDPLWLGGAPPPAKPKPQPAPAPVLPAAPEALLAMSPSAFHEDPADDLLLAYASPPLRVWLGIKGFFRSIRWWTSSALRRVR